MLAAVWGVPALIALAPAGKIPRVEEIHIDGSVLAFTFGIALLTGILFGLAPAFRTTRRELSQSLNQGGRAIHEGRQGLRNALVVSEVALALVLLTGAGLMLKSFLRIRAVDPGFRPENVLTLTVDLPDSMYHTATGMQSFHTRILAKLSSLPGVVAAGAVNWLPLGRMDLRGDFHLEGGRPLPRHCNIVDKPSVSPEYFQAMGIRLLSGRSFTEHDNNSAPGVVVISQAVARSVWPGEDPIGKRITMEDRPKSQDWLTVVGVVNDVRQQGLTKSAPPAIYQPYQQVTRPFFLGHMTFVVRTAANLPSAAAMRAVLHEVDKDQPAQSISSMADIIATTTAEPWFQTRLISIFSMLALLLSAIGIYGVLAYSVTERTHEIAIRMALGAEKSDITRMVLHRSLLLVTAGVALGIAGALAVTRVLARFLFEVKPTDPATLVMVATLLAAVALMAGLLPARRATHVDPMVALRCE
jgi:putative ABC transport system permease protein